MYQGEFSSWYHHCVLCMSMCVHVCVLECSCTCVCVCVCLSACLSKSVSTSTLETPRSPLNYTYHVKASAFYVGAGKCLVLVGPCTGL